MGKVLKIGIAKSKGNQIIDLKEVKVISGKGIVSDRHFRDNNHKKSQITLIEIENINYFNKISSSNISPINFRRNIVTEGIKLNDLINKEFYIGSIKVKAHDLCRPCNHLQEMVNQKNLVKELMTKAGLRCEILCDGKIFVGDLIKE